MIIETCKDCGTVFEIQDKEIYFYNRNKLHLPKRCNFCRQKNKREKQAAVFTSLIGKWAIRKPIDDAVDSPYTAYRTVPIKIIKVEEDSVYYEPLLKIDDEEYMLSDRYLADKNYIWQEYVGELPTIYHLVEVFNLRNSSTIVYFKKSKIDISSLTSPNIKVYQYRLTQTELDQHINHKKFMNRLCPKSPLTIKDLDKKK